MDFEKEREERVRRNRGDGQLSAAAAAFMRESLRAKYSYNFSWLGRPVIQYPQDLLALQEIAWAVKPDFILETGIARGGSLAFFASLLELNAACGGPAGAFALGVERELRGHNRLALDAHPLRSRMRVLEGDSADPGTAALVAKELAGRARGLVVLDSDHSKAHVLAELTEYARYAAVGSYCVVMDTVIEDMPPGFFEGRDWGPGNGPASAVREFLASSPGFEADLSLQDKLVFTAAPGGYLKRVC